jgi:mycothiol synthase
MMTDYTWRTGNANERNGKELERECLAADGRYAIPVFETAIRGPVRAWGTCAEHDGKLVAFAWTAEPGARPTHHDLWLYVHPQHHADQALEKHILEWAAQKARERRIPAIHLRSEANTPELHALYLASGYECHLQESVMVYDLKNPLPDVPLLEELEQAEWSRGTSLQFHVVHEAAFRERPLYKPSEYEDWYEEITEDPEFRPDWSLIALREGQGVGYVICNAAIEPNLWGERGGWIGPVATLPDWRGRGIAAALMVNAMRKMQDDERNYAILHVNLNNPKAQRVYERLGFKIVGQRARYVRNIK